MATTRKVRKEPVEEIDIDRGEIFGVVGATGSGKSSLIGDIEQLAQAGHIFKEENS